MAKKKEEITIRSSTAEYLTYIASVGDVETSFEMRYEDENIWLTQKLMAALYDVDVRTVNYHIKKIFADSELQEDSVIRKFRITADDGKTYNTNHYSLEMIIAVGFKVNSERAVQFRKWVNQIARDYTIKGWVMDVERIKRGTYLTEKYFDEQLERIREIRASERKFYQKVTDLYATAIDYDRTAAATKRFYATVQNKMHFGSKVWHSTDQYRRVIWRCNAKYGGKAAGCNTPHVTEEEVKAAFVRVVNKLIGDRATLLADLREIQETYSGTDELSQRLHELDDRLNAEAEAVQGLIAQNARVAQNQDDYNAAYDAAVSRYETTKAEREKVAADIRQRGIRRREFERFISELEKLPEAVSEFDETLWGSLVDYVTVGKDKTMVFTLIGGTEVKA